MAITVLVVIKPRQSKEARVKEVIEWVTSHVQQSEPETTRYITSSTDQFAEGHMTFLVYFR
jgi:hypothetical protein